MKTTLTHHCAAVIFTFAAFTSYSQTSWLITGNSNITASNFLGTTTSKPVIIKTNNVERLRILASGNIGIGTKTPDNTLHVFKGSAGTVTGWPFAPLVVENSAQCYINVLAPDNLETGIFFGKPESNISGGIIYNNTLSGPNSLQFRTGGNNIRMIIDANGNAAIGTVSTNNYRLKVSHALAGLAIENNSTSDHWELYTSANDGPGNLELFTQASLRGSFNSSTGVYSALSDERLKTNIHPMSNVLSRIKELKPSSYQFKNTTDKQEYNGFIAQDVMKIFPSLVTHNIEPERNLDVYTLDYSGFGVIAIKGIQELQPVIEKQQQQIENQQKEIDELKRLVAKLSSLPQTSSLSFSSAYLKQNVPNPFSKNTIIECYVPSSVTHAQLAIYNTDGRQLKTFALKNTGMNSVTINAGTLSSGQYIYSLFADGKKVDSKNMIITNK